MRGVAAVTGASGYLGSRIARRLTADGWHVIRLVRRPREVDPDERPYDLEGPVHPDLLLSVDVLVHAAYDFSVTARRDIWRVNVGGTQTLLRAARAAGTRRILVLSTMSAYDGTRQLYGQAKLAIEAAAVAAGGCAIRPGLVYGSAPGGMTGSLRRLTRLPVTPLVAPNAHQYPVHEDDLVAAIAALADADRLPVGPIGVAQPIPVRFKDLLIALAAADGRRCRFLPVPWQLVYWGLRAAELLRVHVPFRADSLLGLVRPAPFVPGVDVLESLGVHLQQFESYVGGARPTVVGLSDE